MNGTTVRIINWIWSEPGLADFLRPIAKGGQFTWGDDQLGSWIADLLDNPRRRGGIWQDTVATTKIDVARLDAMREELTEGQERYRWLDEMEVPLVRDALLGEWGDTDIYAHSAVAGFHPNNRYRVHDKGTVYESGWTSASGAWGLMERDRVVCPEPIGTPCSCNIQQRGK